MPMHIKLFASDCYLCNTTEEMIRRVMGPECTLRIYNLAKEEGKQESEKYGVRAVPTIVGNEQKMFEGVPELEELVKCSLEHGCRGRLLREKQEVQNHASGVVLWRGRLRQGRAGS